MKRRLQNDRIYKTESDLCADFIAWAARDGWQAYAETEGWDIVLVNGGIQFGIQAKLRFNATLLRQVLATDWECDRGPNCRGILIPSIDGDTDQAMRLCGVVAFAPLRQQGYFGHHTETGTISEFAPTLDAAVDRGEWPYRLRLQLPDYIPDVVAGSSAPVQLTDWKIRALRVCAHLHVHGAITSKQIKSYGCDPRRWIHPVSGWLQSKMIGDEIGYIAGPGLRFQNQHPVVFEKIRSELFPEAEKTKSLF